MADFELLPQTENIFLIFKDGWHQTEVVAEGAQRTEWQWTKKEATLAFRNPKRDVVALPPGRQPRAAARTPPSRWKCGSATRCWAWRRCHPSPAVVRKIPISAAQFGAG